MTKTSKENCIFCKIIKKEIISSEIYRDDTVIAFMDIQPVNPGHVLVIPIQHYPYLKDIEPDIAAKMFVLAQKISNAIRKSNLQCEGINLFLADGEAAGQEIFHAHLHIFPRFKNDGFGLKFSEEYFNKPPRETLNIIAQEIKSRLE